MSTDVQIQALLKKVEADEMELLQQFRSVAAVAESRLTEFKRASESVEQRKTKLATLRGRQFRQATREKNLEGLSAGSAYAERLIKEVEELLPGVEEKRVDAERASLRLSALEQELKRVQVEKKQLERLLENRHQADRVAEEAREEAVLDEMTRVHQKNKWRRGRE